MSAIATFSRSDGDRSQWPTCGEIEPGVRIDGPLPPEDDYAVQFREKLAAMLVGLAGYTRTCYPELFLAIL